MRFVSQVDERLANGAQNEGVAMSTADMEPIVDERKMHTDNERLPSEQTHVEETNMEDAQKLQDKISLNFSVRVRPFEIRMSCAPANDKVPIVLPGSALSGCMAGYVSP